MRAYHTVGLRSVDDMSFVGCSCQRDGVFLTLLQQEQIQARFHLLLASDLSQNTLLLRSRAHFSLIFSILLLYAVALYVHALANLPERLADGAVQLVELCGKRSDSRRVLTGALQKQVALLYNGVVSADE